MSSSSIHLVVSVAFQDAGDTTRAIAMVTAFLDSKPPHLKLKVSFLSCGSRFDPLIVSAGFNIVAAQPRVRGVSVAHDLGWNFPEFFGSEELARSFILGQLAAFKELRPDIVFHGMWAPASIAARLLGIRTINFLPLPLHPSSFANGLIRDLPDPVPLLTRLPRSVRKLLAWWGGSLILRAPIFHQRRLGAAAAACGWPVEGPISLFDMNMADLNLVNDHPIFHTDYANRLPRSIVITGPLYNQTTTALDTEIAAHMMRGCGPSILVTMGSSGTEDWIFEAIEAFRMATSDRWNVIVLASPSICSLEDAKSRAGGDSRLLVTDKFIPAPAANALADAIVTHGGQGTVQTAVAAGKPIVGVALQIEQQTNLDKIMDRMAGIRIQKHEWKAKNIRDAIVTILNNPQYALNAQELGRTIRAMDGANRAAEEMWKFVLAKDYIRPGKGSSY
jgi:UDP:flavonoid glycosyltransferase YjiC (YdhE family)